MARVKQNKIIARLVVGVGTMLACVGIWTSIVNFSTSSQIVVTAPLAVGVDTNINTNLSNVSTIAIQTPTQQIPAVTTQPPPSVTTQPLPAMTAPPTTMPVQPPPTTTPPPKLITRGS